MNISISTTATTSTSATNINSAALNLASDVVYTFVAPIMSTFGIITNILNIIVFSNKEMKDDTYKYLKMNAFSNMIYLINCLFLFTTRCGQFCSFSNTLAVQIYYWIFYIYVKGIAAIFTVCMQIIVALLRLKIVTNKKTCKLPEYKKTGLIIIIFAAIFYSPYLFTKQIVATKVIVNRKINGTNVTSFYYSYSNPNNSVGNSDLGKWLIIVTTVIRGYICAFIIILINLITKIKLGSHFAKKMKITKQGVKDGK
jgi:hypothetical protein